MLYFRVVWGVVEGRKGEFSSSSWRWWLVLWRDGWTAITRRQNYTQLLPLCRCVSQFACLSVVRNIREEYYCRKMLVGDGELNSFSRVKSRICQTNEPTSILKPSSVDAANRTQNYIQHSDFRCLVKLGTRTNYYIQKIRILVIWFNLEIGPCIKHKIQTFIARLNLQPEGCTKHRIRTRRAKLISNNDRQLYTKCGQSWPVKEETRTQQYAQNSDIRRKFILETEPKTVHVQSFESHAEWVNLELCVKNLKIRRSNFSSPAKPNRSDARVLPLVDPTSPSYGQDTYVVIGSSSKQVLF
jgi:hypothetical protein